MLCSFCLRLFVLYVLIKLGFVESFVVFGEVDTMESKFGKVLLLRAFINSMNNIFWLLHAFIFLQFLCLVPLLWLLLSQIIFVITLQIYPFLGLNQSLPDFEVVMYVQLQL